jgi:hypothetical protein
MSEVRVISLVIPIDPNLGSKNRCARMHRAKRTRIKNDALATARNVWKAAGKPRFTTFPVRVQAIVRRGRVMDEANIIGSTTWAAMIDGIFKDGVTPDDSPRYIQWDRLIQVTGKEWARRPEVVLEIYG